MKDKTFLLHFYTEQFEVSIVILPQARRLMHLSRIPTLTADQKLSFPSILQSVKLIINDIMEIL